MKSKNAGALKVLYLLSLLSLFLPWFTYNSRVMGYCWGWQFWPVFLLPMAVIAVFLFKSGSKLLRILSQVCSILNLLFLAAAFGSWQTVCNIKGGFQWADGFRTAMPTFWLSAVLFLAFCILFQSSLLPNRAERKEDTQ